VKDLEQNTSLAPDRDRAISEWVSASAQPSLPIAWVVVDDLEAAGLVPPDLEDLLTVDADPKARKLVWASIWPERSGQIYRDVVFLESFVRRRQENARMICAFAT
jgi:hypothetical protein